MKKEEFIAALASELRDLSKEDIARSLEYYGELIDERVESGMSVEDAVNELGGAETVARRIMEELPKERETLQGGNAEQGQRGSREGNDANASLGERISREVNDWVGQMTKDIVDRSTGRYGGEADGEPDADEDDDGEREYGISEPFQSVDVQTYSADVRVMRSNDGETRVVTENMHETVEVRDGVLTISQQSVQQVKKSRSFFGINFNFSFSGGRVMLYLADRQWESLAVQTASGDVEAEDARVRAMSVSTKSGDVEARHLTVEGKLEMRSMSGDVELGSVTAGEIALSSVSGDIETDETETGSLSLSSRSGDLEIENTLVHGELSAETTSGDIDMRRSDGRDVLLHSTSGDIDGTLLTPKAFNARSTSGDVSVPQSVPDAGKCEVRTVSGDISLRIAP